MKVFFVVFIQKLFLVEDEDVEKELKERWLKADNWDVGKSGENVGRKNTVK